MSELPDGLHMVFGYLTEDQHDWLVRVIDAAPWSNELSRRVQHYGYKYDYRTRSIDKSMQVPMPEWGKRLGAMLVRDDRIKSMPDQIIVNEYAPGQGIGAHVDCEPCFGPEIVSLSLLSGVIMDFRHRTDKRHDPIWLEERDLLIMTGESRYDWTHGIAKRTTDTLASGKCIPRSRRLSITLRSVILENE
jgi:alkylated DNA repair dioxygenase AlkB